VKERGERGMGEEARSSGGKEWRRSEREAVRVWGVGEEAGAWVNSVFVYVWVNISLLEFVRCAIV